MRSGRVHSGARILPRNGRRLGERFPEAVLTPREEEMLGAVVRGLSNQEVASKLDTAIKRIKMHLQNVYRKLGVLDRSNAVIIAIERGILHVDSWDCQLPGQRITRLHGSVE